MMPLLAASHGDTDAATMVFVVPIVAILCTFAWLIVKTIMAPFHQKGGQPPQIPHPFRRMRGIPHQMSAPVGGLTEEEQAILLKLQRTIGQMERRIESLETILIDNARTKENYGTKH